LPIRSAEIRAKPVTLPPGRARLATTPVAIGSIEATNTIGIVRVAFLAATTGGVPRCDNYIDIATDQFGCRIGELVRATGQPVFDADVLALDVPEFAQALPKATHEGLGRRAVAQEPYAIHWPRLLCLGGEDRRHQGAENEDNGEPEGVERHGRCN
jgi:hypothetical protein